MKKTVRWFYINPGLAAVFGRTHPTEGGGLILPPFDLGIGKGLLNV